MRTVILGPPPAEIEAWIERRRSMDLDRFDEVWNGEYHVSPHPNIRHALIDQQLAVLLDAPARRAGLVPTGAGNLGEADNYRVPDRLIFRRPPVGLYLPTAAIAIEIVSPDDESWLKLDHFADHGVDELLFVDPLERSVVWLALRGDRYERVERSALIDLGRDDLAASIEWPEPE